MEENAPVDPYLLLQIGEVDMWLVVAALDLTEVESAATRTRIRGVSGFDTGIGVFRNRNELPCAYGRRSLSR